MVHLIKCWMYYLFIIEENRKWDFVVIKTTILVLCNITQRMLNRTQSCMHTHNSQNDVVSKATRCRFLTKLFFVRLVEVSFKDLGKIYKKIHSDNRRNLQSIFWNTSLCQILILILFQPKICNSSYKNFGLKLKSFSQEFGTMKE